MTIHDYPSLKDVATRMARDNGCVNRQEPVEDFYSTCDEVLADKDHSDLQRLDEWISTLTEEQKDTLADGEETEMEELAGECPIGGPDNRSLCKILDDIFEVM